MKYAIMYRGQMVERTDNLAEARKKVAEIGDTAYIQYSRRGIKDYEKNHSPLHGEQE